MGTIQHDAIIATTWDEESFTLMEQWIKSLPKEEQNFYLIQPIPVMNHYQSIVLAPDGSKEGWEESDTGNDRRRYFIARLKSIGHWDFISVTFGEHGKGLNSEESS